MTASGNSRTVAVNRVDLQVVDAGPADGPLVVLAHGFPELAYSWRHQIPALADAGYHVLAPDQRGYGRSSRPEAITDYDIVHLTDDLLGLVDDAGAAQAVFVGHDWGSMIVWQQALRHPERVAGVVGMSVPFTPRSVAPPIQMLRQIMGDNFFYMLHFQEPGVADADLGRDPAATMRRMLCGVTTAGDEQARAAAVTRMFAPGPEGFVDRLPEPAGLPDWLGQDELDHYIAEFTRTGFTGGINWYRNLDRNWELSEHLAGAKVEVPSLFIGGADDPVLVMSPPGANDEQLSDHRGNVIIGEAGHWVQQEKPREVNEALLGFLEEIHEGKG
jgi:pimeloyl-ACP methyl ester carboxylesterase